MLSLLLQRNAVKAYAGISRVGFSAFARSTAGITLPRATRTFMTSSVVAQPAKAAEKTEKPKEKKEAKTTKTKKTTAVKKTTPKSAAKKAPAKKKVVKPKVKKPAVTPARVVYKEHAPPKHPGSPYINYINDQRTSNQLIFTSVQDAQKWVSEVSAKWKTLSDAEKQKYVDQHTAARAEYHERLAEYLKNTPPEILKVVNQHLKKKGSRRIKDHSKKGLLPLSAFLRYGAEVRDDFKKTYTGPPRGLVSAASKAAAVDWRAMSDEQKKPYFDAWKKDKEEYLAKQAAAESS